MSRGFSLYLDLLRLLAALAVVFSHANMTQLVARSYLPNSFGHNAVVVFFLLSGYVIAYVTNTKENNWTHYWISRLARVYSVAIPAILLTVVCDRIGSWLNPAFYAGNITTHDYALIRVAASLAFANELWFVSIMPFSNSPYWSICYEMAYYFLYAIWCFSDSKWRNWYLLGAALLIGPKILLLAPVWLLGVMLYHHRDMRISAFMGWSLWLGSILAIILFQWFDLTTLIARHLEQTIGSRWFALLHFSKRFLGDYVLALLIAGNFVGFRAIADQFDWFWQIAGKAIRFIAGYTFSVYLFHLPLMFLMVALIDSDTQHAGFFWSVLALTLLASGLLGHFTETQKETIKRWLLSKAKRIKPAR